MQQYLDGIISSNEFYGLSESCYSSYGDDLKKYHKQFEEIFMARIPDACLYYIDEPSMDVQEKEKMFYKEIEESYNILKKL